MHYFQQKGIGDSSLSKNILMQTLKPIQVTEHVMEASYYHKHENRRKCIWFQEAFIFSPRLQKRIFKTYWLLINYASAIHRTPAKPLNTKNVEVITSGGASTKAGPSAVGGHQYPEAELSTSRRNSSWHLLKATSFCHILLVACKTSGSCHEAVWFERLKEFFTMLSCLERYL